MLELLIVIAIIGIIASIGVFNGRRILQSQEERAAITSIQQTVWQGATAAAARGSSTNLTRTGNVFTLTDASTSAALKRFELPPSVSTNLPEGLVLTFTPPGKVDATTLDALPEQVTVSASGKTTELTISLIGEVKAEAMP